MLKVAWLHEADIQKKFAEIMHDERYMFYWNSSYRDKWKATESTWARHEFACLDTKGNLIGYMGYDIDRDDLIAKNLGVISFVKDHPVFAKDLSRFLRNIFEKYNLRKLKWTVIRGNPVEEDYDRLCARFGGRIVGILEKETRLLDHDFHDMKIYEVHRENYMMARRWNKIRA